MIGTLIPPLLCSLIRLWKDMTTVGGETVNRAQLAVILDRFAENVLQMDLYDEPFACTESVEEGLIIYLQDSNGDPIEDATIESSRGTINAGSDNLYDTPGVYAGLEEGSGHYTITINAEGYNDHIETIVLEKGACHVIPQTRTITLF